MDQTRTGIEERHFNQDNQETSDLAVAAAKDAIAKAGITPEEIGLILVATVTQDQNILSVACMVQEQIGAVNAAAMGNSGLCRIYI
ncbi:Beta-ketoacyl-[acyl-carrier-protein] synthase III OS=Lysinibacillus sphaericus OX=1421 GN=fabHA PE=3 SV=1 [Lysinibacillus sphaericus]